MNRKFDTLWHLLLYFGLIIGSMAVMLSRFDATRQYMILVLLVVYYLTWGMAYHHSKQDATRKLAIEYLLIALIALGAGYLVLMS